MNINDPITPSWMCTCTRVCAFVYVCFNILAVPSAGSWDLANGNPSAGIICICPSLPLIWEGREGSRVSVCNLFVFVLQHQMPQIPTLHSVMVGVGMCNDLKQPPCHVWAPSHFKPHSCVRVCSLTVQSLSSSGFHYHTADTISYWPTVWSSLRHQL